MRKRLRVIVPVMVLGLAGCARVQNYVPGVYFVDAWSAQRELTIANQYCAKRKASMYAAKLTAEGLVFVCRSE